MSSSSFDLHAYFSGCWRFMRTMLDSEGTSIGEAEGEAAFQPEPGSFLLRFKESGQLRLSANQRIVAFSRCFDYLVSGDMVHVTFADGIQSGQAYQSYHYDPVQRTLTPVAEHLCIHDRYNGSYRLIDAGHFDLLTRIDGPHKDYRLRTQFTKKTD